MLKRYFGNYFTNDNIKYWFYSFMPLIWFVELAIYFFTVNRKTSEVAFVFLCLFGFFLILTSFILILCQIASLILFNKRFNKLSDLQKKLIQDTAKNITKTEKIFKTDDVLIYYGMFSKKVFFMDEIEQLNFQTSEIGESGCRTSVKRLIIKLKTGKDAILNYSKEFFDGEETELPWDAMTGTFLLGVFLLIMGTYPRIMDLISGKDVIKRVLFHAGYDLYFWIGALIISIIIALCFIICFFYVDFDTISSKFGLIFFTTIIVGFFLFEIGSEKNEGSDIAREDLRAYLNDEYLYVEAYCKGLEEHDYENVRGWYKSIFELNADSQKLSVIEEDNCKYNFIIFSGHDMDRPEIDKKYKLYYLKNTKIVVSSEVIN